jgi:hypothetical protein
MGRYAQRDSESKTVRKTGGAVNDATRERSAVACQGNQGAA